MQKLPNSARTWSAFSSDPNGLVAFSMITVFPKYLVPELTSTDIL